MLISELVDRPDRPDTALVDFTSCRITSIRDSVVLRIATKDRILLRRVQHPRIIFSFFTLRLLLSNISFTIILAICITNLSFEALLFGKEGLLRSLTERSLIFLRSVDSARIGEAL